MFAAAAVFVLKIAPPNASPWKREQSDGMKKPAGSVTAALRRAIAAVHQKQSL